MPRIKATPESIGIGNRIRKERESISLTREKMAEMLDITPGYIADLERGEARLSVSGLINLCNLFHCSADFLLFGRTDSFTMSARIDSLPVELREQVEELIAKQLTIIEIISAQGSFNHIEESPVACHDATNRSMFAAITKRGSLSE